MVYITDYTARSPELVDLLALGECIATKEKYTIDTIRCDADFNSGYLGVIWTCSIGECKFNMHLTLATWDADEGISSGVFNFDGPPNLVAEISENGRLPAHPAS